jgi:phospholipid N-methyltransferase
MAFLKAVAKHFLTAIRHPKHLGSLFPSSSFVIQRIQKKLPPHASFIVEYGPGTGNITRSLLRSLSFNGMLLAIEVNQKFKPLLESIQDPRLQLRFGGVLAVLPTLIKNGEKADAVVSGIPFSFLPAEEREKIVQSTRQVLRPGGCFIVYQSSRLLVPLFEKYFDSVSVSYEIRNLFPYFIIVGKVN